MTSPNPRLIFVGSVVFTAFVAFALLSWPDNAAEIARTLGLTLGVAGMVIYLPALWYLRHWHRVEAHHIFLVGVWLLCVGLSVAYGRAAFFGNTCIQDTTCYAAVRMVQTCSWALAFVFLIVSPFGEKATVELDRRLSWVGIVLGAIVGVASLFAL